ncbi:hypothetical protein FLX56_27650, partial [Synechococcus moorigangaii CMS01]|nr:hypothetical protein [Synechococcus moorigangaii CMS01]
MEDFNKFKKSLQAIDHYVYALCEIDGEKRTPFYIGKGVNDRCLQHLNEKEESPKKELIKKLLEKGCFGIDILRHGIKTDKTAKLIEATCIDLLGIGELSNKVRGSGSEMGRATIEEIHNLKSGELIEVRKEHEGLAFLLNKTYKSGMSELELFEATRGVWNKIPRDSSIQYAYATYGGLIKEVYQIHCWVKAGTQQYFTRTFEDIDICLLYTSPSPRDSTKKKKKKHTIKQDYPLNLS